MENQWIINAIKTGVLTGIGLLINKYRKPFYAWAIAQIKLSHKVLKLEGEILLLQLEVSVLKSKQMADIHTDRTPTYIVNPKGEMIYANPAWVKLLGYRDPEAAYGMRFMDAIHKDDYKRIKAIQRELILHPSGFEGFIKFVNIENGNEIKTFCVSELIHDKDNKLIETVGRLYVLKE